ncbi:MAG TPA: alpha-amylase family glycosyl hydrolase [Polyangiaceae bacterium]|jgi:1,4-alpha-glucan branching enzyme|nr:alpha-amylase family glycosyl hydrolase [Polyangiaceae bacterium]
MANVYAVLRPSSDPGSGMGANLLPQGGGASFRVWAPNASAVSVLLRPSDAQPIETLPLTPDPSNRDYHSADVSAVAAGHQYRFSLTNSQVGPDNPGGIFERVDPYARDVESSDASAPGYVVAPAPPPSSFATPRFPNFIIYQCHVGSFAGLNDPVAAQVVNRTATFRQIATNRLDYIRSMNFDAVEFLPTAEEPFKSSEGYAPSNYFAPESDYGDPSDLAFLVDECHKRGLAVIFDVVYNHAVDGDQFDRLLQFDGNTVNRGRGIYFSSLDNFGPVPDFDRPEVRAFFTDNVRQCFREYRVDGLRFDSAHAIQGVLRGTSVMKDILGAAKADAPDKFLIAEHDNPSIAVGTLGFDASWQMDNADAFVALIAGGSLGDVEVFVTGSRGDLNLSQAFSRVLYLLGSHDQIFASYGLNQATGNIETDKPDNRYFVERVGGVGVGRGDWVARAKARMAWALNVTLPCTPMMFMGTECMHHGYWNPAEDAYGEHRFDFALTSDAIGTATRALVRDANQLRWDHPALRTAHLLVTHRDPDNRVLGFKRFDDGGDVLLVVLNLSDNEFDDATYGVDLGGDGGAWEEVFNSQAPQYGGFDDSGNFLADLTADGDGRIRIRLPKWSLLVFRKR